MRHIALPVVALLIVALLALIVMVGTSGMHDQGCAAQATYTSAPVACTP